MLETADAQHSFHFDTVQMPLNVMDAHFRSFENEVLPVALKHGIGVLGMKSMGDQHHPEEQGGDAGRVPALRDEPAGRVRHHRHRLLRSSTRR